MDIKFLPFLLLSIVAVNSLLLYPKRNYNYNNVTEIKEGQTCVPGMIYKQDCNTCHCVGAKYRLMCTHMACLQDHEKNRLQEMHGHKHPHHSRLLRAKYNTTCVPGKVYKQDCKRCYCNEFKNYDCTNKPCKAGDKLEPVSTPEDVRSEFSSYELQLLPKLMHAAAVCKPGTSYMVDCNACLCMANGNLLCQKNLCYSHHDVNRLVAKELNGLHCTKKRPAACVTCNCRKNLLECKPIIGCKDNVKPANIVLRSGRISKKCEPKSVYNDNCNKCYCQEDGQLRCTLKFCLNKTQSDRVQQILKKLEANSL